MVERRWLLGLGPPLVATLMLGLIASGSLGAADRPWDPPPCPGGMARLGSAASDVRAAGDPSRPVPDAWFTLDPRLDAAGSLSGQRLRLGIGSQRARHVDLPPESSAAGPFGRVVLIVADDERRSEIRAIDRRGGCAWQLGGSSDVIRQVTLDPAAAAVYEFRVDRATRADLGVWRRPLDGSAAHRILDALPHDRRFGPTWSTSLGWSVERDRLIVQSCGHHECRTRVVDPLNLRVHLLDEPGAGRLLGVAGGRAVGYADCTSLPCPIIATELASGERHVIAEAAGLAVVTQSPDGPRVALEGPGGATVLRLDGSLDRAIAPPSPDAHIVPSLFGTPAGPGLPGGWIAWSPDARSPQGAALTRLSDGRTVPVEEVAP